VETQGPGLGFSLCIHALLGQVLLGIVFMLAGAAASFSTCVPASVKWL
jgi:hypothetical protein